MRKNFQNIGFYPQPVLVIGTYDENGTPDAMNVGWGGLVGSVYVELNISEGHKTTANLRKKGAFTVSFADQAHLVEADKANFLAYDRVRRVYRLLGVVVGQAYHDGQAKM